MEKEYQTRAAVSLPFSIEILGTNGSTTIVGDQVVVMAKLTTSEGRVIWATMHNN